jgi:hypothetical protein
MKNAIKDKFKDVTLQILFKIVCLAFVGLLLIGSSIFRSSSTEFAYILYGVSAIFFSHFIKKWGVTDFLLFGSVYSLLLVITLMPSQNMLALFGNISWFIFIGALVILISLIEKKYKFESKLSYFLTFAYWLIGFIIVYLIMTLLNIYAFGLSPIDEFSSLAVYLLNNLKAGAIIGLGVGLGMSFRVSYNF